MFPRRSCCAFQPHRTHILRSLSLAAAKFLASSRIQRVDSKAGRACRYWWFDTWDCLVNAVLRLIGGPRLQLEPGEFAIDPHIHTMYSRCSISRLDDVLLKAASLGLRGIGILDHNNLRGVAEAVKRCDCLKDKGLLPADFVLIPGVEVNSTQGHIGALFVQDSLPSDVPPEQVVKHIHEAGGLAVAVHPYHTTGIGDALFDLPIDAVETHCGSVFHPERAAKNLALLTDPRLNSVAKLGASDAHYVCGIASCCTIFREVDGGLEGVRRAIASGSTRPIDSGHYRRLQRILSRFLSVR